MENEMKIARMSLSGGTARMCTVELDGGILILTTHPIPSDVIRIIHHNIAVLEKGICDGSCNLFSKCTVSRVLEDARIRICFQDG